MTCILNMCIPLSVRILLAHLHGLCTLLSNDQYPHVMNENEDLHNARDVYNRYSFTHTLFFFFYICRNEYSSYTCNTNCRISCPTFLSTPKSLLRPETVKRRKQFWLSTGYICSWNWQVNLRVCSVSMISVFFLPLYVSSERRKGEIPMGFR